MCTVRCVLHRAPSLCTPSATIPASGETGSSTEQETYAGKVAAGGGQKIPDAPVPLLVPTHAHSPLTVLIDLQSVKSAATRDDRSKIILHQLQADTPSVISLIVEPVTYCSFTMSANSQLAFQRAMERLRSSPSSGSFANAFHRTKITG
jgi:hypothetical protein